MEGRKRIGKNRGGDIGGFVGESGHLMGGFGFVEEFVSMTSVAKLLFYKRA